MEKSNKKTLQEFPEFQFGDGVNPEIISQQYYCEYSQREAMLTVEYDPQSGRKKKLIQKYYIFNSSKLSSKHVYEYNPQTSMPLEDTHYYYSRLANIREKIVSKYSPLGDIVKKIHDFSHRNGKKYKKEEIYYDPEGRITKITTQRYHRDGQTLKGEAKIVKLAADEDYNLLNSN